MTRIPFRERAKHVGIRAAELLVIAFMANIDFLLALLGGRDAKPSDEWW